MREQNDKNNSFIYLFPAIQLQSRRKRRKWIENGNVGVAPKQRQDGESYDKLKSWFMSVNGLVEEEKKPPRNFSLTSNRRSHLCNRKLIQILIEN